MKGLIFCPILPLQMGLVSSFWKAHSLNLLLHIKECISVVKTKHHIDTYTHTATEKGEQLTELWAFETLP